MILRWLVATLHLLVLPLGLGAIWARARALGHLSGSAGLGPVFAADNLWGVAAVLWIGTGLWRAFGGLEKGSQFYLASPLFWVKMALLGTIILLEIWPMTTFIGWRLAVSRGEQPDTRRARQLWIVNHVEMLLIVAMVFVASFMARGFGLR